MDKLLSPGEDLLVNLLFKSYLAVHKICVRIVDALKCGANMSYFKEALKLRGLPGGWMRAPQLDIDAQEVANLKAELTAICKDGGFALEV